LRGPAFECGVRAFEIGFNDVAEDMADLIVMVLHPCKNIAPALDLPFMNMRRMAKF
jgi:hypothetical protein